MRYQRAAHRARVVNVTRSVWNVCGPQQPACDVRPQPNRSEQFPAGRCLAVAVEAQAEKRVFGMLWLILLVLLVIAIGGGIFLTKFLFLVLFVVALVWIFNRVSGKSSS